jgi:peroxiredoxin
MSARRLSLAVLAVAAATLLTACTGKDAVNGGDTSGFRFVSLSKLGTTYPVADRKTAGAFTEGLLDGNGTYSLSQDAGKVVVLNFWAHWCGPCVTETPQFDNVYRQYKNKDVNFVGIDTKDTKSQARDFVKAQDITYPMVSDETGETAIKLGHIPIVSLPATVIVDKNGKVAAVYGGAVSPQDLTPVLNSLLAET